MPWIALVEIAKRNPATKKEIEQVLDYRRRRAKPKFYADENLPSAAVKIVGSLGGHVLTAQEANRQGHPDENHSAFALKDGRVLLTCDRDYLDEKRFPLVHCPVIVVCDFGSGSSDEMRQTFRCLGSIFSFPQFFDKWTKIDAKRESWIAYCRYLNGTTSRTRYRLHRGKTQEWVD
jgi:hypothetical protein